MKMYQIQATVMRDRGEWEDSVQIPTFYLNTNTQGIVDKKHAGKIARTIVNPFGIDTVNLVITEVNV